MPLRQHCLVQPSAVDGRVGPYVKIDGDNRSGPKSLKITRRRIASGIICKTGSRLALTNLSPQMQFGRRRDEQPVSNAVRWDRTGDGTMLFRLSDVTKTYGPITAFRHLTVEAEPGAVGLLGPNGAGKTTLIRTLLGLIKLDNGQGEVLGMDVRSRRLDVRQAVGFVPEGRVLVPGCTRRRLRGVRRRIVRNGPGRRDAASP